MRRERQESTPRPAAPSPPRTEAGSRTAPATSVRTGRSAMTRLTAGTSRGPTRTPARVSARSRAYPAYVIATTAPRSGNWPRFPAAHARRSPARPQDRPFTRSRHCGTEPLPRHRPHARRRGSPTPGRPRNASASAPFPDGPGPPLEPTARERGGQMSQARLRDEARHRHRRHDGPRQGRRPALRAEERARRLRGRPAKGPTTRIVDALQTDDGVALFRRGEHRGSRKFVPRVVEVALKRFSRPRRPRRRRRDPALPRNRPRHDRSRLRRDHAGQHQGHPSSSAAPVLPTMIAPAGGAASWNLKSITGGIGLPIAAPCTWPRRAPVTILAERDRIDFGRHGIRIGARSPHNSSSRNIDRTIFRAGAGPRRAVRTAPRPAPFLHHLSQTARRREHRIYSSRSRRGAAGSQA